MGPPKTEAAEHTIPMTPMVVNVLKEWRLQSPRKDGALELVFPNIQEGYDVGGYGAGDYDAGEQSLVLNLADGTSRDALDLVNAVMAKFASIFPGV